MWDGTVPGASYIRPLFPSADRVELFSNEVDSTDETGQSGLENRVQGHTAVTQDLKRIEELQV